MSGSRAHAAPFYCPYCGDEELMPHILDTATGPPGSAGGEGHGHWACRSCRRAFRLTLTAVAVPAPAAPRGQRKDA